MAKDKLKEHIGIGGGIRGGGACSSCCVNTGQRVEENKGSHTHAARKCNQ